VRYASSSGAVFHFPRFAQYILEESGIASFRNEPLGSRGY